MAEQNQYVGAYIEKEIESEAANVLAAMGLTISEAIRILLTMIARDKELPFEPLIPNEETIAAMQEARSEDLPNFNSVDELFEELNADD